MKIDEAKERIVELESFIQALENYNADTFEKESLKLYVQLESVSKVADELNKKGYQIGNRKVISKDVSDVIRSKPVDEMHRMAKRIFKRKRASSVGWF
jgi:nitrogen regulatory protein PII